VDISELQDIASEPHWANVYIMSSYTELAENLTDRLSYTLCNGKPTFYLMRIPGLIIIEHLRNLCIHLRIYVTRLRCAKTAKRIEVLFGVETLCEKN